MIPIQIFSDIPEKEYTDGENIISIIYRDQSENTLHVRTNGLLIDCLFYSRPGINSVTCYDLHNNDYAVWILFDRKLTIQEIAEELSQKLEYNIDRIRAMANNKDKTIKLALVPSKRAV